jgi:hypothetical protein
MPKAADFENKDAEVKLALYFNCAFSCEASPVGL